tara:strand:+ start:118 stop:315 length:198 start_codon:yes stop_codon:yes gene_type:complete
MISHDIYQYGVGDRVRATDNGTEYYVLALYPTIDKICVIGTSDSDKERFMYRPFELDRLTNINEL